MSFGLDLLAIITALGAAVLAASCVRRPLYHSSSTHQLEDSRLWALVCAILILTAIYQLLAIQFVLDGKLRGALDVVANHGQVIEYSFYTAAILLVIIVASALYAWLGHSVGRNITLAFGTFVTVAALPLGLYTRALDAARATAGIPDLTGTSLQVAAIVVGAAIVAVAAGVYRYRRQSQAQWRQQLRDPSWDGPGSAGLDNRDNRDDRGIPVGSGSGSGSGPVGRSAHKERYRRRPRLALVRGR